MKLINYIINIILVKKWFMPMYNKSKTNKIFDIITDENTFIIKIYIKTKYKTNS